MCYSSDYLPKNQCERIYLYLRWTSKVWVNHNIDSWWTTHWCVNHLFIYFSVNHKLCKPINFSTSKSPEVWAVGKKEHLFVPLYSPVCSCSCNTITSIDCCHSNILILSFLLDMFIFSGYIISYWLILWFIFDIFGYDFDYPKKNQCGRLGHEFSWTFKVWINYNNDSLLTTHWCVNRLFLCFSVNHKLCKPRRCQLPTHQKLEQLGSQTIYSYQSILQFVPVSIIL